MKKIMTAEELDYERNISRCKTPFELFRIASMVYNDSINCDDDSINCDDIAIAFNEKFNELVKDVHRRNCDECSNFKEIYDGDDF